MLFCIGAVFIASNAFGQANPTIGVLPSNSGQVAVGATNDLLISIGNTGTASIAVSKLRPIITVPASVTFLADALQTGLPAGWTILSNTGSQLRLCTSSFVVPATSTTVSETIINEPIRNPVVAPIKNTSTFISQEIAEPNMRTIQTPIPIGASVVSEPVFPIKTIKAKLITTEPILGKSIPLTKDVSDEMISECGNSFSIPNNDKEGSYTNFWFDGKEYYTQTTSPLIKTIPTKISKLAYVEGCKKLQLFKLQNSKS
jgi:hypothetical protein